MHDLLATILHLLGLDHEKLTYQYAVRNFRLTDVAGRIVKDSEKNTKGKSKYVELGKHKNNKFYLIDVRTTWLSNSLCRIVVNQMRLPERVYT